MNFLFLVIPFMLWMYCFRHFFNGQLPLYADAISYAEHIRFYTDNIASGVYPLWDPHWFNGAPYDFFLRRIGDVNPFLFLFILFKWLGISSANAYLIFLGVYYFLAAWAFYLITHLLLKDRFYALIAYTLFLFSSWGSEIFYNYIIIIFVPLIWFFYFLLCFGKTSQKAYFLGMCFCVGLVVTTYIPFFFLTILVIFSFFFCIFYGKVFLSFLRKSFTFFNKNKVFTLFCVFFLLVSCIPGLIFYKESKGGEFVLPNRHSGADASSAVAVGLSNVASGDIISHGFFDRVFDDQEHIDMGDIYVPYVFFLILLVTLLSPVTKLIFFLLFNILGLSLITITSAAGIHQFLYEHIIIFKFIRNIYYFFWLAMLPMAILLIVASFKSLLTSINASVYKIPWLIYIILSHLLFVLFLLNHQGVLWGAWVAIGVSLVYFLILLRYKNKFLYWAGFFLLLLAVFIQSMQVYESLADKLFQLEHQIVINSKVINKQTVQRKVELYYASSWFTVLVNYIDPQVLDNYRSHPFMLYDNVVPYIDRVEFFSTFQSILASQTNIAFVPKFESEASDLRSSSIASAQADINPVSSGALTVTHTDANTFVLKAHLLRDKFLVINDNYNKDWHGFINGHQARILRANVSFKGLWIPAGESEIILRFSSPLRYAYHFALIALFAGIFLYLMALLIKTRPLDSYV